jgi:hypothetical protein
MKRSRLALASLSATVSLAMSVGACGSSGADERGGAGGHGSGGASGTGADLDGGPASETCGNGLDDDGDGAPDDGCPCQAGETQPCFVGDPELAGRGGCAMGVQTCDISGEFGTFGECLGSGLPDRSCDPEDDDDGDAFCGDAHCDVGEDCEGVCCDPGKGQLCNGIPHCVDVCPVCGDGICSQDGGESIYDCPQDCPSFCGDGLCHEGGGESCSSCPGDCEECPFCGDGQCNGDEYCTDCPDCGACCGDGVCDYGLGEDQSCCDVDCGPSGFCGDGICCEDDCPADCGTPAVCGDGTCGPGESEDEGEGCCAQDCGACCAQGTSKWNGVCCPYGQQQTCNGFPTCTSQGC